MDDARKKIRLSLLIILFVVVIESLFGFSSLFSGLFFSEYDQETADETLAILQETDPELYEMIINPADTTYREEFQRIYTKRGNRALTVYGIILIVLSGLTAAPALMAFMATGSHGESESDDGDGEDQKETAPQEDDESF